MMSETFDAYHLWLGIPPEERPAHHYRLLGIRLFEDNRDVISNACDQRMSHIRTFQTGQRAAHSQRLLNELAAASLCLLNPQRKAEYDERLRQQMAPSAPAVPEMPSNVEPAPVAIVPPYADSHFSAPAAPHPPGFVSSADDWSAVPAPASIPQPTVQPTAAFVPVGPSSSRRQTRIPAGKRRVWLSEPVKVVLGGVAGIALGLVLLQAILSKEQIREIGLDFPGSEIRTDVEPSPTPATERQQDPRPEVASPSLPPQTGSSRNVPSQTSSADSRSDARSRQPDEPMEARRAEFRARLEAQNNLPDEVRRQAEERMEQRRAEFQARIEARKRLDEQRQRAGGVGAPSTTPTPDTNGLAAADTGSLSVAPSPSPGESAISPPSNSEGDVAGTHMANDSPQPDGGMSLDELQAARTWTSISGQFSVEAFFVAIASNQVQLRRLDDEELEVPLDQLSESDQEWADAADALRKHLEVDRLVNEALDAMAAQDHKKSRASLLQAMRLSDQDLRPNFYLGLQAAVVDADAAEAKRRFQRCATLDAENVAVLNNLAITELRSRDLQSAAQHLEIAYRLEPSSPDVLHNLRLMQRLATYHSIELPTSLTRVVIPSSSNQAVGGKGLKFAGHPDPTRGDTVPSLNLYDSRCLACDGQKTRNCPNCRKGRIGSQARVPVGRDPGTGTPIYQTRMVYSPCGNCRGNGVVACQGCRDGVDRAF